MIKREFRNCRVEKTDKTELLLRRRMSQRSRGMVLLVDAAEEKIERRTRLVLDKYGARRSEG